MTAAQINDNIRTLLAPELIAGLRMNLNRPLGDGRDDDSPGNNVVDEPMPTHTQIKAGTTSGESGSEGTLPSQFEMVLG